MNAFLYGVFLQWKLDLRNKGILLTYYVVPLIFFGFISGIFISINPASKETLIESMTVFGVTMGAILGSPTPLTEHYGSALKKAYYIGGIPLYIPAINNMISAFIHLYIMSMTIFFIAPIAFDTTVPTNLIFYFISLAFFIIVSLTIGTLLGLFFKSASKLTMISQFIFLPSLMLSGIMFPSDMLPETLQNIGKILPATWGYKLLLNSSFCFDLLFPLLIIAIVSIVISIWRLSQIKIDS